MGLRNYFKTFAEFSQMLIPSQVLSDCHFSSFCIDLGGANLLHANYQAVENPSGCTSSVVALFLPTSEQEFCLNCPHWHIYDTSIHDSITLTPIKFHSACFFTLLQQIFSRRYLVITFVHHYGKSIMGLCMSISSLEVKT